MMASALMPVAGVTKILSASTGLTKSAVVCSSVLFCYTVIVKKSGDNCLVIWRLLKINLIKGDICSSCIWAQIQTRER